MKSRRSIPILVIVFSILLGTTGAIWYKWSETMDRGDVIHISAIQLTKTYDTKGEKANPLFKERILLVDGFVKEVSFLNNRNTVILQGTNKNTSVLCDMTSDQSEVIQQLKPGQHIQIQGICKGFLKDAILLNCIFIKTLTNE